MAAMTTSRSEPGATGRAKTTMRALVQEGYGSADVLHIRDVARPGPSEGRVLVRVKAASVNALDWHTVHGIGVVRLVSALMRQKDEPVRGVDVAGTVEAIGPGVTRFAPGDEVFGGAPAAFAEYASAREQSLVHKPAAASFEEAAAVNVAGRTALYGLRDVGQLRPGQRVLVCGAGGGVGTFAVQIANALGAHVTASTGTRNVELVRGLGPDLVIDHDREDPTRRSERYDLIFDVAADRPLGRLVRLLAPGGSLVLCGAARRGGVAIFARIAAGWIRGHVFGQRIVFFVARTALADLETLAALVAAGKVHPAIDRVYPFAEAREAVRYVGTGQARAKVVIRMD